MAKVDHFYKYQVEKYSVVLLWVPVFYGQKLGKIVIMKVFGNARKFFTKTDFRSNW